MPHCSCRSFWARFYRPAIGLAALCLYSGAGLLGTAVVSVVSRKWDVHKSLCGWPHRHRPTASATVFAAKKHRAFHGCRCWSSVCGLRPAFLCIGRRHSSRGCGEWGKYWPYMMLHAGLAPLLIRRPIDLQHGLSAVLVLGAVLAVLVDAFVRWDHRFIVSFYNPNEKFWNALAFAQMAGYVTIAAVLLNHQKSWFWRLLKGVAIASSVILVVKSGTRGQFVLMAAAAHCIFAHEPADRKSENLCVGDACWWPVWPLHPYLPMIRSHSRTSVGPPAGSNPTGNFG